MGIAGFLSKKSATAGPGWQEPEEQGACRRVLPFGELASSCAASSAATASARLRAARSERRSPVSVSESRRDVRWNNVAPMLLSRRDIAFDSVALERPRAFDAAVKERCSTPTANMAQASKSGRRIMETIRFTVYFSLNDTYRSLSFP